VEQRVFFYTLVSRTLWHKSAATVRLILIFDIRYWRIGCNLTLDVTSTPQHQLLEQAIDVPTLAALPEFCNPQD